MDPNVLLALVAFVGCTVLIIRRQRAITTKMLILIVLFGLAIAYGLFFVR